ncbi:MAG: helix-turn-helix transcriptional regulator [Kiloniellales bacterium]|nr:helix-turn-helix transcriptional regulator [Kiloniellales bacterium]
MGPGSGTAQSDRLIGAIYDAITDAMEGCSWCQMLPQVCDGFDAAAGGLFSHDFVAGVGALRHSFNIDRGVRDTLSEGQANQNAWMRVVSHCREGAVVIGSEDDVDLPMLDGGLGQAGASSRSMHHFLYGVITREGAEAYLISLVRPLEAAPFDDGDKTALSRLLPHMRRSLKVHSEIVRDRDERESLIDLLDHLPVAFLLVGPSGQVRLKNRAATELLEQRNGLCLRAGYLATQRSRGTAELRRMIAETASLRNDPEGIDRGEHFIISRGSDHLPLVCLLYPVGGTALDGSAQPGSAVAMLVKDPQLESTDTTAEFVSAYSLTKAEARLLRCLIDGQGLFEAAERLNITRNTARTHMRNIYAKVGTHRQADLVRLTNRFSLF